MKAVSKKAFTLIELLVVIAIIAILAAILFPVFAQAKVAAKKTAVLSNAKQMGTSIMLYMGDTDDVFCPAMIYRNDWGMRSFAVAVDSYMKSVGIVLDPFAPATLASNPFLLNSMWAMPTMRSASAWCPTNLDTVTSCAMGVYNANGRTQLTGGARWGRSGIAAANLEPGYWMWSAQGYAQNKSSMNGTAVTRPADTMLVTQANHSDMMWHQDWNPDEAFRYWGDGAFNLWGNNNMTCGPAGRIGTNGQTAGVYPTTIAGPSQFPTGTNVTVYVDGHAKAENWRALHGRTVVTAAGTRYLAYASPEIP